MFDFSRDLVVLAVQFAFSLVWTERRSALKFLLQSHTCCSRIRTGRLLCSVILLAHSTPFVCTPLVWLALASRLSTSPCRAARTRGSARRLARPTRRAPNATELRPMPNTLLITMPASGSVTSSMFAWIKCWNN